MINKLRNTNIIDLPWIIINRENSEDYKQFFCLPSAIREKEYLEDKGKIYDITTSDNIN